MRLDLAPIIAVGHELLSSIEARSWSRSAAAADRLLKLLSSPTWAETAPGMVIWSPEEKEADARINLLRCQAMNWMSRFVEPGLSQEADDNWPVPARLDAAVQGLAELAVTDQNASVSAKTVPTAS